jgi:signal peptidase II
MPAAPPPSEAGVARGLVRHLWGEGSRAGLTVALGVLAADQASKWWLLHVYDLPARGQVRVAPFLDLVMVWNRGISYGLFQQETELGRLALIAFAVLASLALAVWMAHTPSRLSAVSQGLILGGAIGNAIDRALYGAVADFVSLHAFGFYWYVFNIADVAIVAGVFGLLYESFRTSHKKAGKGP